MQYFYPIKDMEVLHPGHAEIGGKELLAKFVYHKEDGP